MKKKHKQNQTLVFDPKILLIDTLACNQLHAHHFSLKQDTWVLFQGTIYDDLK